MIAMQGHKNFWDKNAGRYDRFMRKDRAAYDEMYELIRPVVKAKTVLELATGTGLIAKHIVNAAAHIEATDASAEMIAEAQSRFEAENPDFELALQGDANGAGFLDVIEQYGSTPSGNLARHYAGICYLRLGDLDNAAAYLAKYKPAKGIPAEIVNAQNIGLQGDIAVEKGDYAAAIKLFEKAAKVSDNNLTAPMYLRKAALAANAMGNKEQALGFAQRLQNEFPASAEAQNAEKLMGTIQQ